jgi:glycerol uptake facilitator-like aquaporin
MFGINPALSFAYQFWYCFYNSKYILLTYTWATVIGPLVGGLLGGVFFELVYRPVAKFYQ